MRVRSITAFLGGKTVVLMVFSAFLGAGLAALEIIISAYLLYILAVLGVGDHQNWISGTLSEIQIPISVMLAIFVIVIFARSLLFIIKGYSIVLGNELFLSRLKVVVTTSLTRRVGPYLPAFRANSLISEVFSKSSFVFIGLAHAAPLVVQCAVMLVALIYLSPLLTAAGILYILITGGIVYWIQNKVRQYIEPMLQLNDELHKRIKLVTQNWLLIRVSGGVEHEEKKFVKLINDNIDYTKKANALSLFAEGLPSALGVLVVIALLYIQLANEGMDNIVFVAYLYLFLRLMQVISQIANYFGMVSLNLPYFLDAFKWYDGYKNHEVLEIVTPIYTGIMPRGRRAVNKELKSERKSYLETHTLLAPDINVKGVRFSYDGKNLFESLSFEVKPGARVGIVGPSGSGKSTLLGLMLGFVKPDRGVVTINGLAAVDYVSSRNENVGYAGPDPFLFDASLKENLLYMNNRQVDDAAIYQLLQQLDLGSLLEDISGDLDVVIHSGHSRFSTGQMQRLAVARALLRGPKLLILDEITANLDTTTETRLANCISDLNYDCTTVISSHSANMIKGCSQVIDLGTKS